MLALYIILGLVVLGIAVLAVPIDVGARFEYYGRPSFTSRIGWLFGLVRFTIAPGKKRPKKEKKPRPERKKRTVGPGFRAILDILLTRGLFRQVFLLGKRSLKQLRWRDFRADVRVGLDDPADSGMLFAYLGPVLPFLPRSIAVRPQTRAAVLEGYVRGGLRIIPLLYVVIFLRFLFSLPVLRALGKTARLWWRNRRESDESTPEYTEIPDNQAVFSGTNKL